MYICTVKLLTSINADRSASAIRGHSTVAVDCFCPENPFATTSQA